MRRNGFQFGIHFLRQFQIPAEQARIAEEHDEGNRQNAHGQRNAFETQQIRQADGLVKNNEGVKRIAKPDEQKVE